MKRWVDIYLFCGHLFILDFILFYCPVFKHFSDLWKNVFKMIYFKLCVCVCVCVCVCEQR